MIRTITLATVLATGLSMSAVAADEATAPATTAAAVTEYLADLSKAANANQVRDLLVAKGYSNVTNLIRDEQGRWTGAAVKDGKSVAVSVALPENTGEATTN